MALRKIGVGIIGSGRIGRLRANLVAGDPRAGFLALSDPDEERVNLIADEVKADFRSTDNEAVLTHPDVEAVIVSTPEHAHADPVCRALELGKTVLVEKPLELSLERADQIIEAVRKYNGDLHVGYTQRLRRRYLNAKEQISQGRLGKLLTARMVLYNPMNNGAEIYKRSPHASPVTDTLTYVVDIGLWYFEGRKPVKVYAQGGSKIFPHPNNVGDWAWAIVTLDDGSNISFGCSWIFPDNWPANITTMGMDIMGSDGAITIDDSHKGVILATKKGVPSPYAPDASSNVVFLESMMAGDWSLGEFWGPMRDETRLFLEHAATGRAIPNTKPDEARTTLEVTLAIEKSAATNQPVDLPLG